MNRNNSFIPQVWAPTARSLRLHCVIDGQASVTDMGRSGHGWWRAERMLETDTDYGFCVDDGPVLPDPRSRWQPAGVHGLSRHFDTRAFAWSDHAWTGCDVRGSVIYEMHTGTFTPEGTLDSAIDRLDYLAELGIDMVELMPVAAFAGSYGWGYDGVALFAVHEPYGGPAALQRFVDAAHARQIAVCLDVVYNHLGPSGNYLSQFGPYFTERHHTPWGAAINLDDTDSTQVRAFIVDNARYWLQEFHIDALRLDAVHALKDDSPRHLLAEMSDSIAELSQRLQRPLSLIAESDMNDPAMVIPTAEGGLGMTAQWADDVHHAIHAFLTGERHAYYGDFGSVDCLIKAFSRIFVHDGEFSTFRGSFWGAPVPVDMDGHRFVAFASDHDQIGNRATGDRPTAVLSPGQLAVAAALVFHSPCSPMLFMGEEWGASTPWQFFTDHQEPELVDAIREGRQREFATHAWEAEDIPDPQAPSTFERSRLDWAERDKPGHRRLLQWYKDLIALRHTDPAYTTGDLRAVHASAADDGRWIMLSRSGLTLAINPQDHPVDVPLTGLPGQMPESAAGAGAGVEELQILLAWDPAGTQLRSAGEGPATLHLPAHCAAFISRTSAPGDADRSVVNQ